LIILTNESCPDSITPIINKRNIFIAYFFILATLKDAYKHVNKKIIKQKYKHIKIF